MKILDPKFGLETLDHVFHEAVCDALVAYCKADLLWDGPTFTYTAPSGRTLLVDVRTESVNGSERVIREAAHDPEVQDYLVPIIAAKAKDLVQAAISGSLP